MDLRNLPLATTPAGKNFVIKCLHPADGEIKTNRAPGAALPTVGVAFDTIDTIPFPAGAFSAAIVQWPNLIFPACVVFYDGSGTYVTHWVLCNSAVGGAGWIQTPSSAQFSQQCQGLDANIDSYRVTSQSVTCDVIAPAMANQGTILSAQFIDRPQTLQPTRYDSNVGYVCASDFWAYNAPPTVAQLVMGTTAYNAKAIDGFYQPLKLDKFKFVAVSDTFVWMQQAVSDAFEYTSGATYGNWPIYTNNVGFSVSTSVPPKPSGNVVGMTFIEGTAGNPQTSLRLRIRQVVEIIPKIGGTYAPIAEAPFPPDELAFKMCREISQRMKDAYPSSYNASGTLLPKIKQIAGNVLKFADPVLDIVSLIPGVGNVTQGLRTAINTGKAISQVISKNVPRERSGEESVAARPVTRQPQRQQGGGGGRRRKKNKRSAKSGLPSRL